MGRVGGDRSTARRASRTTLTYRLERWVGDSPIPSWLYRPTPQRVSDWFARLPRLSKDVDPPLGPRPLGIPELPPDLVGTPGILRDAAAQREWFERNGPLPQFVKLHHEAFDFYFRHLWRIYRRVMGHLLSTGMELDQTSVATRSPAVEAVASGEQTMTGPHEADPALLTKLVKAKAAELGISAVGVTVPNPVYNFSNSELVPDETRVVVCLQEQNWEATQTIPSIRAERAAHATSTVLRELMIEYAGYINELGYRARLDRSGLGVAYAVEAGLGQLGLNGQLLSPFAGSRMRIGLLVTDAPLVLDEPVDYGIEAICDLCQVCVRNCPSGAIRSKREWHRGVYKASIKPERCIPVTAVAHGCSVCQKVCPIQRYGLPKVVKHYRDTGRILGKGTDELEGYRWPVDGMFYGPDSRPPVIDQGVIGNPDFFIDLERKERQP